MGFSLGGIGSALAHGFGDVERGIGNWNGPHPSGSPLEKAGRAFGAMTHPAGLAGDAFHNLAHPVETWDAMPGYQKDIVKGAGVVGAGGLALAGGAAALGGGAAAAAGGETAALGGGEAASAGGGGMGLGARVGRALMVHEAVGGLTGGGGLAGGGFRPDPYAAQQVAHETLGNLNRAQFG